MKYVIKIGDNYVTALDNGDGACALSPRQADALRIDAAVSSPAIIRSIVVLPPLRVVKLRPRNHDRVVDDPDTRY